MLDGVELNLEECDAGSDLDDLLEGRQWTLCKFLMPWIPGVSTAKAGRIYSFL